MLLQLKREKTAGNTVQGTLTIDGTTAETDLIQLEERQRLKEAMEKLSPREQTIIRQIYGIDCEPVPMKEVARQIGLSYDRVKKVLSACRKKFKVESLKLKEAD